MSRKSVIISLLLHINGWNLYSHYILLLSINFLTHLYAFLINRVFMMKFIIYWYKKYTLFSKIFPGSSRGHGIIFRYIGCWINIVRTTNQQKKSPSYHTFFSARFTGSPGAEKMVDRRGVKYLEIFYFSKKYHHKSPVTHKLYSY